MRERAGLFDSVAEIYDRSRPSYPDALIDAVLGPDPSRLSVLDVASGTGIAARQVAARGAQVLGVELNPEMAAIAERHGIATEVSSFESWDSAGRRFDVVTCAQAWHWLDPTVALTKMVSLLRPAGQLCLFWNLGSHPDELAEALRAAYQRVLPPDAPPLVTGYGADRSVDPIAVLSGVADALRLCDDLAEPQVTTWLWHRDYTSDEWLDELQSHSDHAALPSDARTTLFEAIRTTLDRFGGAFRMPYTSLLISAARA